MTIEIAGIGNNNSMLEVFREELNKEGVFDGHLPEILTDLVKAVNNHRIPERMKLAIAVSEFILFFSQFQINIKLIDGAIVPINSITFCISGSGSGKDSSKDAIRACFGEAYKALNDKRKEVAKKVAIAKARDAGEENPTEMEVYKAYYSAPSALFSAPDSTLEGLTSDFNRLQDDGIGAGYVYSGEIGDEFSNGIEKLMQFMAEVYDKGNKEVKAIKGKEGQLRPIESFPVNALFMGSQAGILFEIEVKNAFKKAFNSKLARRSFFMFSSEECKRPDFKTIHQYDKWVEQCREDAFVSKARATAEINRVSEKLLKSVGGAKIPIQLSKETQTIMDRYTAYNEDLSATIEHHFPISKLVKKHLHWKALKFAGALALFNGHKTIEKSDYIAAITYCESLNRDMELFEVELSKQPHEVFADFMNAHCDLHGKGHMSFHQLKKLEYISNSGSSDSKVNELVKLASSYDKNGIYTVCTEGICFEKQVITDTIGVSFVDIDNQTLFGLIERGASKDAIDLEKHKIAATTTYGYSYEESSFEELGELLAYDYAYTPFRLRTVETNAVIDRKKHPNASGGVRGKENVLGGCKWIVIDVDKSSITAEEAHFMLSDINHHIALTSNGSNHNKYRVIIELDSIVDIPDIQWKFFISAIAESLAIVADPLPKSQIFFSYSGRKIYSVVDAEPLRAKEFIIAAAEKVNSKERKELSLSPAQKKAKLQDPLSTFNYAYEATDGIGSRSMIRAALHARTLEATKEETISLMYSINDYWAESMPEGRFERTVLAYVERMF